MFNNSKKLRGNEYNEAMLDSMPFACFVWDAALKPVACNSETVRLFGFSGKEELLANFHKIFPEFQPDGSRSEVFVRRALEDAFESGGNSFEFTHTGSKGEEIVCEVTMVKSRRNSDDIVIAYTRDLRGLRAMLSAMQTAERELRRARDAAERNAAAKSEFLANMSHEIRTPMNAVLGMLRIALGTDLNEKQRNYLEKADFSAKALLRIINDLLDFSKIEAGKFQIDSVEFSLADTMQEVNAIFEQKIADKGLKFISETDAGVPAVLIGDPLRLNQILLNLLGNAVKFTASGSVGLKIAVENRKGKSVTLHFIVKDSGIGIAEDVIPELFSAFSQADNSTTRRYGGTGLGLAISRNLVNLMRGDIWCESRPGEGSEFHFTAQFGTVGASAAPEKSKENSAGDTFAGKKVLIAEDNEINQQLAAELFAAAGVAIDIAANGQEALEMLSANYYDAIFMDIQMPIMDGFTAAISIRKNPRYARLPIIAMVANAMGGDRKRSLNAGMNDCIGKPLDPEILDKILLKYLK